MQLQRLKATHVMTDTATAPKSLYGSAVACKLHTLRLYRSKAAAILIACDTMQCQKLDCAFTDMAHECI